VSGSFQKGSTAITEPRRPERKMSENISLTALEDEEDIEKSVFEKNVLIKNGRGL
jgi:hypothetical protein